VWEGGRGEERERERMEALFGVGRECNEKEGTCIDLRK
jgi:hypothetical protein